jgi:hypothetical protein
LTLFGKTFEVPRRWLPWVAGAAVLLLLFLIYPFKSTIVPRWRVHLADEAGTPVAGINVTEHWQHHLIEATGHEDVQQTDASGVADFPERWARASLITRTIDFAMNLASDGRKAQFGPYASIVVWGRRDYSTAVVVYTPGATPQREVMVSRSR